MAFLILLGLKKYYLFQSGFLNKIYNKEMCMVNRVIITRTALNRFPGKKLDCAKETQDK
jgi:hypothetical protein